MKYKTVKDKNITYVFYDMGVTSNHNTTWKNENNRINVTISNSGTALTATGLTHYWANNQGVITGSWACEFDLIEYTDNNTPCFRVLYNNGSQDVNHYFIYKNFNISSNTHLKFVYDSTKIKYQIGDGNLTDWVTTTFDGCRIALRLYNSGDYIKYKNFVIYSI